VSSGYFPAKDDPGPDEILEALREGISENPRLKDIPAEEIARQLVLEGYVQEEYSPTLVVDMLDALEAEKLGFESYELSEKGKPYVREYVPVIRVVSA
jgi:hypothetical protein